jgi:hypothetical protein
LEGALVDVLRVISEHLGKGFIEGRRAESIDAGDGAA